MRIRINLEYILMKNKISLKAFLVKNKIETYEQLLAYCDERNMNPVEEDKFNAVAVERKAKEENVNESPKKSAAKRNTRRSTSKTQNKTRSRTSSKKVKSS